MLLLFETMHHRSGVDTTFIWWVMMMYGVGGGYLFGLSGGGSAVRARCHPKFGWCNISLSWKRVGGRGKGDGCGWVLGGMVTGDEGKKEVGRERASGAHKQSSSSL